MTSLQNSNNWKRFPRTKEILRHNSPSTNVILRHNSQSNQHTLNVRFEATIKVIYAFFFFFKSICYVLSKLRMLCSSKPTQRKTINDTNLIVVSQFYILLVRDMDHIILNKYIIIVVTQFQHLKIPFSSKLFHLTSLDIAISLYWQKIIL